MSICDELAGRPASERASRLRELRITDPSLALDVERLLECETRVRSDEIQIVGERAGGALREAVLCDGLPPIPERIGDYEVVGVLGVGGASVVYEALQRRPNRRVAIKALWTPFPSRRWAERFEREAQTLASLRHPGVPQVYAASVEDLPWGPAPCIVMEVVEGAPITCFASERGLDVEDRVALLVQACRAVEHAHQRGVIHRDLKPGNMLVEGAADPPRVRVLDFGLAKLLNEAPGAEALTLHGRVMGSLPYMSPEQVDPDLGEVDTRTDVFGLGAVGYELLADRPPHDVAGGGAAALRRIASAPIEPLSRLAGLPADLSMIFETALASRREERYAAVSELRADLERWLRREPISVVPPMAWYRAVKFARRRPGATAAAIAGALALAALGASMWRAQAATSRAARIANARFAESVESAGFLVGEVLEQLRVLPGSAPVRRATLDRLLGQTEILLEERPDDPALLGHHAGVLHMLSDLELMEGRVDASLALRRRAHAIRAGLAERFPDDPDRQADASIALVLVGDALKAQGRLEQSVQFYEQALEIDQRLAAHHPARRRLLDNLYWSHQRLWGLCLRMGRWDAAQRHLQRTEPVVERLLALAPSHPQSLLAAVSYGRERAQHARAWLRLDEAVSALDRAIEAGARLLQQEGRNRDYALAIAPGYLARADLLRERGRVRRASRDLDRAEAILRRLLAADDRDAEALDMMEVVRLQRGRLALATGSADEALAVARRALARIESGGEDPGLQPTGWTTITSALDLLMRSAAATGAAEQAEAARRRLIALHERELSESPADGWRIKAALASLLLDGEEADAQRALALLGEAERETPSPRFRILATRALALTHLGDAPEAATVWRRAERVAAEEGVPADTIALHRPATPAAPSADRPNAAQ